MSNLETDSDIENIENVRVVVRVRPYHPNEKKKTEQDVLLIDKNSIITNYSKDLKPHRKSFTFDGIISENSTQINVYQKVALPIVEKIFEGYNGTIFAYGQTGSGKTYTMSGNQEQNETQGIIPNTFSHLFNKVLQSSNKKSFAVSVTYLEIYNEEVRDLLSSKPNEKLEVRERADVGVCVTGLQGFTVHSIDSISKLMNIGNSNRATRATLMNSLSSRSHAIFTIAIETKDNKTEQKTMAKLNLVDLAGSERIGRTHTTGEGFKEATNINQSLFVLSNVISALVEDKAAHIPYRNSKLTRLLQDSLGGNSKTVMIATISPSELDYNETLCTLRYASKAKLIKNHVRLNVQTKQGLIEFLENKIIDLQNQLVTVSSNEIQIEKRLKSKKSKTKVNDISNEMIVIENEKKDLQGKLTSLQNKILTGGQNLLNKAKEQRFLLESSLEEINYLAMSHQVLEEKLEEKEMEHYDLKTQYSSLQDEDLGLDRHIEYLQKKIEEVEMVKESNRDDHKDEMAVLKHHGAHVVESLGFLEYMTKLAIPRKELQKIERNVYWNGDKCEFLVQGLAHAGNNSKEARRRFRKHIPKRGLLEMQLNKRKTNLRPKDVLETCPPMKNQYKDYKSRNLEEIVKKLMSQK